MHDSRTVIREVSKPKKPKRPSRKHFSKAKQVDTAWEAHERAQGGSLSRRHALNSG